MKAAGAALLALFWAGAATAQMYKCVDARGVTHYADKPTAGCANAAVDIRASPPISGALAPPAENRAQQEADFRAASSSATRPVERSAMRRPRRKAAAPTSSASAR